MNYLTNYYKNLCEQLQDQVNNLSSKLNMLNEMDSGGNPYIDNPYLPYVPGGPDLPPPRLPPVIPTIPDRFPPVKPAPKPTPKPGPAPAENPGSDKAPPRPVPSDYPPLNQRDPRYGDLYRQYMEWYRQQSKDYQKANPPPPLPKGAAPRPYYRGGAGGGGIVRP